ncbi:hypothetical protein HQN90_30175 [Paenibacillus alba]|uniref:hypothetical protein n=1 Tax=Paenibacillus alba TaxID=1197127 RepID=UPI0015632A74|nr:hypothetical protein [Paenibacillus alba]NQX70415.1 hypothetical protein [Paenibacillus alba]
MQIIKYEPQFPPVEYFITRFFVDDQCLFEQETKVPLPTLIKGDQIELFNTSYSILKREFGFNEDAFFTVYYIEQVKDTDDKRMDGFQKSTGEFEP